MSQVQLLECTLCNPVDPRVPRKTIHSFTSEELTNLVVHILTEHGVVSPANALIEQVAPPLPSSEDLDVVVEEQKIAEQTSGVEMLPVEGPTTNEA